MPRYLYEIIGGLLIVLSSFVSEQLSPRWRKACWLTFILLALGYVGLGVRLDREADQRDAGNQAQIKSLKSAVDTANQNQRDNTKIFTEKFAELSQRVSALQTQVRTESLRTEATQLKAELEATQKALNPPKAKLQFSFFPYPVTAPGDPSKITTITTLPVQSDNSVHVELTMKNDTTVEAERVQILIAICNACKYAKEPAGCSHPSSVPPVQRECVMDHVVAKGSLTPLALDILPPLTAQEMQIRVMYRCHTCVVDPDGVLGTIHLANR